MDRVRAATIPVSIESLVAFRVAFGLIGAVGATRYLAYGWVHELFVAPTFYFPYPGFEWLRPLPAPAMYGLYCGLVGLSLAIAVGWRYRLATAGFLVGFTYLQLLDRSNYLNHYYLIFLLAALLSILPANRALSLDCFQGRVAHAGCVPVWCIWILRFQLGVVYVFGAVAKLNPDWLLDAQPMRIWLGANVDLPWVGSALQAARVGYLFSYAGLAFDALVVPALLWRTSRPYAYAMVVLFHLSTSLLFPIGVFPWLMIALTPIFFAPDWPSTLARRFGAAVTTQRGPIAPVPFVQRRVGALVLALYIALQVAIPLRLWFRPGNPYWYEDGFRFSWQIMVMEKYGRISFRIGDSEGNQEIRVNPAEHLTRLQLRMMATQPDMILSFARHVERSYADRIGGAPLQVHADSYVSLNGRPHQRFVDPKVDLCSVGWGTPRSEWIVPPAR